MLIATLTVGVLPVAVTAQETTPGTNLTDLEAEVLSDDCPSPQAINDELVLCSAEYDDGTAILRFKADSLKRVHLTDSGAFMRGGHVPQRTVVLREGEVNTVRWDVVEHEGQAGVGVNHKDGLYSIPLEDPFVFVGGPWGASDAQITAITAVSVGGGISVLTVLRGILGRDQKPERVA